MVAATGRPAAIASISEIGNCSLSDDKREDVEQADIARGIGDKAGENQPVGDAGGSGGGADRLSRCGPSPTIDQPPGDRGAGEGADQQRQVLHRAQAGDRADHASPPVPEREIRQRRRIGSAAA